MKLLKYLPLFLLISLFHFSAESAAASNTTKKKNIPAVQKLDIAPNLFQSENMFFSGQPNLETLEWLQNQGVDLIINLRSESENKEFAKTAFNEKNAATKLGMRYISLPVSGNDAYSPENLKKLSDALGSNYNKVLIHCRSCGRVTNFMIAYLVRYKSYELAEAIDFGKQLKFEFALENLLDNKIDWQIKQ